MKIHTFIFYRRRPNTSGSRMRRRYYPWVPFPADVGWVVASASGLLGHECAHPSSHPTVVRLSASSGACTNTAYLPSRSITSSQACPSWSLLPFLPTSGVTITTASAFTARWVSGSSYLLDWGYGSRVKRGVGGYFISWRRMKESKKNLSVFQCCRS